jgi:hypothetical protein
LRKNLLEDNPVVLLGRLFLRGYIHGKKCDGCDEAGKAFQQGMSPEARSKSEYRSQAEPATSQRDAAMLLAGHFF